VGQECSGGWLGVQVGTGMVGNAVGVDQRGTSLQVGQASNARTRESIFGGTRCGPVCYHLLLGMGQLEIWLGGGREVRWARAGEGGSLGEFTRARP